MATYLARERVGADIVADGDTKVVRDGFGGDRSLKIFAEYLRAFVNRYLRKRWVMLYGEHVSGPIDTLVGRDAYEGVAESELPCLFVYRQLFTKAAYALSSNVDVLPSQIQICWVPPTYETMEERHLKEPFAAMVARRLYVAIERGRDPSYIHPDDDDPNSQVEGTFIYGPKFMNPYTVSIREGKWSKIDSYGGGESPVDPTARQMFPALFITVDVEEWRENEFEDEDFPDNEFDDNAGLDARLSNDDGATYPDWLRRIK